MKSAAAVFVGSALGMTALASETFLVENKLAVLESSSLAEHPTVQKFAGNIYTDEYFSDSVYYDYLDAFWLGYNMQSYLHATTCLEKYTLFMNAFHNWHLTATYKKENTELWDLFFLEAGTNANDTWYKCFLFYYDFRTTYETKWESFNDFGDFYLSFIFNMLQKSLNIKNQTENMIDAYSAHDTVTFMQSLGSVLRSILDFQSYTAAPAGSLEDKKLDDVASWFGYVPKETEGELTVWEREAIYNAQMEQAKAKRAASQEKSLNAMDAYKLQTPADTPTHVLVKQALVKLAEDYEWGTRDYVQIPFAFLIGGLHALPDDSEGPECSANTASLRFYLLEGFDYQGEDEGAELAQAQSYYIAGSFLDEVGVKCQRSVSATLTIDYFSDLASNFYTKIPINLAYNGGFMWTDAIYYIYYTPETVPDQDWGFFVAYLLGDFIVRIFYHDPTPQQVDI